MEIKYQQRNSGHSNSFETGISYQDFICIELAKYNIILQNINSKRFQFEVGENLQGFEIKLDGTSLSTGRLSIEIAEKTDGSNLYFIDSGIFRNDQSFIYIQGNYSMFWLFGKSFLRQLYISKRYEIAEHPKDFPTIRKFYLPFEDADKYCIKKFIINKPVQ